jgi:hypothetical protein
MSKIPQIQRARLAGIQQSFEDLERLLEHTFTPCDARGAAERESSRSKPSDGREATYSEGHCRITATIPDRCGLVDHVTRFS